jgi:hypothetical protein
MPPFLLEGFIMLIQQTSVDAYRSIGTSLSSRVLALMGGQPLTCDEAEIILGAKHQSVSSTIRALVKKKVLSDTGERRQTRSGRMAIVWGVIH